MSVLMPENNHEDQVWKNVIPLSADNTKFLHDRRIAKNMTQKDVSDKANINLRHYQMFECGTREIANASFRLVMSVCGALEIEPKELL
jgi:transcriptional regulator with XRE-family HTH domain